MMEIDLTQIATEAEKATRRDMVPDDVRGVRWLAPLWKQDCFVKLGNVVVRVPRLTEEDARVVNSAIASLKAAGSDGPYIAALAYRAVAQIVALRLLSALSGTDQSGSEKDLVRALSETVKGQIEADSKPQGAVH